jgi:hypothetical protein
MDDYPYNTLRAGGWFRCDGLNRLGFPTFLWDVLHRFGHTGTLVYHGHPYHQLGWGTARSMWTSRLTPLTRP